MDAALSDEVRARAQERCEYCRVPQSAHLTPFQIDHIIARKHRGDTTSENLALACFPCNNFKGPNIASIDPTTGELTRLFNPRADTWDAHFALGRNGEVTSSTVLGRATIACLHMNGSDLVTLRALLIGEGALQPSGSK